VFVFSVLIGNSQDTTISGVLSLTLLDGEAGPVQSLSSSEINNSSIVIQWQEPAILNGTLLGYSILINGTPVSYLFKLYISFTNNISLSVGIGLCF